MPATVRSQPATDIDFVVTDRRGSSTDRVTLTLDELEAHDPHATARGTERRFLCPLPACRDKQHGVQHRSLAVNVETGAWTCHRCRESGKLRERWTPRRDRERVHLRKAFELRTTATAPAPVATTVAPTDDRAWLATIRDVEPLAGTPGAAYLERRGIPADLVAGIDALYSADHYGRPSILFRVRDRAGRIVGLIGRYVDGRDDPKGRDVGKKSHGVFAAPGARTKAGRLVITEAPIDALSLAAAGIPALALGGTSWPDWLPSACTFRPVVLALDADKAGDEGCARLTAALQAYGAKIERWRPSGGKDWNELLATLGPDQLRAALASGDAEDESARLKAEWSSLVSQADALATGAAIVGRDGASAHAAELAARATALLDQAQPAYDRWAELRRSLGRPWQEEARKIMGEIRS